jgi:hypothetical protein
MIYYRRMRELEYYLGRSLPRAPAPQLGPGRLGRRELRTMAVAPHLPRADLRILARCGQSVALKHPDKVVASARIMFG